LRARRIARSKELKSALQYLGNNGGGGGVAANLALTASRYSLTSLRGAGAQA